MAVLLLIVLFVQEVKVSLLKQSAVMRRLVIHEVLISKGVFSQRVAKIYFVRRISITDAYEIEGESRKED